MIRFTDSTPAELPMLDVSTQRGSYDLRSGTVRVAGSVNSLLSGSAVFGVFERREDAERAASGVGEGVQARVVTTA